MRLVRHDSLEAAFSRRARSCAASNSSTLSRLSVSTTISEVRRLGMENQPLFDSRRSVPAASNWDESPEVSASHAIRRIAVPPNSRPHRSHTDSPTLSGSDGCAANSGGGKLDIFVHIVRQSSHFVNPSLLDSRATRRRTLRKRLRRHARPHGSARRLDQ